jgi:hypothetical protein
MMTLFSKFIGHLLDPSERKLVEQAREFSHDFDQLVFQAIDLDSMRPQSETKPILDQFLDQNRVSVVVLRDCEPNFPFYGEFGSSLTKNSLTL